MVNAHVYRHARAALMLLPLTFHLSTTATLAQATRGTDATKAGEQEIATEGRELTGVLKPEALAAFQAAQKAGKAATAAAEAAEQLAEAAKAANSTLEILKKVGKAAVTAATAAAQEARAAAEAAAKAADGAVTEAAKAAAGLAAGKASIAATTAATAKDTAAKADTALAAATQLDEAKKQVAQIVTETNTAAVATTAAARAASAVVVEAVKPSLPVLGAQDENVFEALRARITGGAIFFNGAASIVRDATGTSGTIRSDQFSQAATYLAFETQPRLWAGEWRGCGNDESCRKARELLVESRGYSRLYIDPFANVRLTTIPVTGAANTLTTIEAPSGTFLQSQKAIQLQLGATMGFNFGRFTVKDSAFHWGVGPLYRFMFQNVTDSQRTLRPWDIDNDLFKLQSGGVRLTLFQKDQQVGDSARSGWAPAAYLDVSRGYFENFETATGKTEAARECLKNVPACLVSPTGLPPEDAYAKQRDLRWYLEGRIFLQYLYFGFDMNTGRGPDDLRFISGLSVKLDSFFTRRK